jgi:hypothetical protein
MIARQPCGRCLIEISIANTRADIPICDSCMSTFYFSNTRRLCTDMKEGNDLLEKLIDMWMRHEID